uniref:Uncharacterized protein n=1 Tax=Timema douglasi TaxID=61478 RepID=A0A7R8VPK1_TIMDO|nr:unnamed protein product [Timema douglasi]
MSRPQNLADGLARPGNAGLSLRVLAHRRRNVGWERNDPVGEGLIKEELPTSQMPDSMRTRSLNAPSPIQQFGPCGRIMKNSAMVM